MKYEKMSKDIGKKLKKFNFRTLVVGLILAVNVLSFIPLTASAVCDGGLVPHPQTGVCYKPSTGGGLLGAQTITGLLITVINILLGLAFIIAVFFVVLGGYRYLLAGGDEKAAEKGKVTLTNAAIGLVIIILSYVIVNIVNNTIGAGGVGGAGGGGGNNWGVGGTIGSDGNGGVGGNVGGWFGF